MTTNITFQERRENRAAAYERLAVIHQQRAEERYTSQRAISSHIPLGQPILVGHHSESRHRADIKRMDNHMRAMSGHLKKAEYYKRKAETMRTNKAIFIEDPHALERLEDRLTALETLRSAYKAFNKAWKHEGLEVAINGWSGNKDSMRAELVRYNTRYNPTTNQRETHDWGKLPHYMISNVSAGVVRYKKQLEAVKNLVAVDDQDFFTSDNFTVSKKDMKLIVTFKDKPSKELCTLLKRSPYAFKWTPSVGAWTRKVNQYILSKQFIDRLVSDITKETVCLK